MSSKTYKSRESRKSNSNLYRKSKKSKKLSSMKRAISLPSNLSKISSKKSIKLKKYNDLQIRNKFLQI